MRLVMTWYGVTICVVGISKTSMAVEDGCAGPAGSTRLPRGGVLSTVRAGLPSVVQELVRPLLERGRRRGHLLLADEAGHNVVWDRGPAGELGLERRDRGNGLWSGADPQEACFHILLDRRIKHLCEERRQRIIPADDHRQAWLLRRDVVATHRYLRGCGWGGPYGEPVTASRGPPPPRTQERGVRARVRRRMVPASRGSWRAWGLRTAAALAGGERTGPCAAPRRGSLAFAIA